MTTPAFRTSTETKQGFSKRFAFTSTLTTNDSEVVVDVTKHMSEVHKISLACTRDVYINFDGDASATAGTDGTIHSFLLEGGEVYADDNIFINDKITAINSIPDNSGSVRGVIWGR